MSSKGLPNTQPQRKTSFAGDVLKLVSGTTIAQFLSILTAPVLARLYAPDAFGTAAVFTSIVALVGVVACLRYDLAIVLPEQDQDATNLLAVSLSAALIITGLTAGILLFKQEIVIQLLNAPELAPYMWLIPLTVLVNGAFFAFNYWNSRTKHFWRLSVAKISQAVMTTGTKLGFGISGQADASGLISGIVLGNVVTTIILSGQIWREDRLLFRKNISLSRMKQVVCRYKKFPLINLWSIFLNNASWQLPTLLLSAYFSPVVVGYYSQGYKLVHLPVTLIGSSIASVFFQRAAEARAKGNLIPFVDNTFRRLVLMSLFPMILLSIIGQDLFVVFLGATWAEAGIYTQILSPWMFFLFISSPLSTLYSVLEKQELGLIFNGGLFLSRLIVLTLGGHLANPRIALILFSFSGILAYGYLSISVLTVAGISLKRTLQILGNGIVQSIPLSVIIVTLRLIQVNSYVLLGTSLASLCLYFGLVIIRDPVLRTWSLSILEQIQRKNKVD